MDGKIPLVSAKSMKRAFHKRKLILSKVSTLRIQNIIFNAVIPYSLNYVVCNNQIFHKNKSKNIHIMKNR